MKLTYVIVTHNRHARLLQTLRLLPDVTPLPDSEWDIHVVDNGSIDGTFEALATLHLPINVTRRPKNEGVAARNHGINEARGEYVVLLDDDSYPTGNAIGDSLRWLDANLTCAAVAGRCVLPNGALEACALPNVFLSGAVCARADALRQVGGFRDEFFRKAGEYDVSFRLWLAGWRIDRFDDVLYRHDKIPTGRNPSLAHFMDVRNNLILAERFLPHSLRAIYRADWLRRYSALAQHANCGHVVAEAIEDSRRWAVAEAKRGRCTLPPHLMERCFHFDEQCIAVRQWKQTHGVRRVLLADFGKNIYATFAACRDNELKVAAIIDNHDAFAGMRYRSVAIRFDADVSTRDVDGIVLANISPAVCDSRAEQLQQRFDLPVLKLWQPRWLHEQTITPPRGAEAPVP